MNLDQYRALKEDAGFVKRSDRGRIAVSGADRADYLQGLLTNDIVALSDGQGCYAAYLTPQGRMVADVELFCLQDQLLLDVHGSVKDMLVARFEELVFTEDVAITDWTDAWVGYLVSGPAAERYLAAALTGSSETPDAEETWVTLQDHACRRSSLAGSSLVVGRTHPLGVKGFDVWVERPGAEVLRQLLVEAGCTEVDDDATEVVRIEHGRPAFPADLNGDTIPLEAGIEDRAVSLTKGCYVGQEVIVRVLHRGQGRVSRRLTGLKVDQPGAQALTVSPGAQLWHDGDVAGKITSAGFSPAATTVIGLGYVKREWLEPGTTLDADAGQARVPVVVTALPFFAS